MQDKITRLQWIKNKISELSDDLSRPWSDFECVEWPFGKTMAITICERGKPKVGRHVRLVVHDLTRGAVPDQHTVTTFCKNALCMRPAHVRSRIRRSVWLEAKLRDLVMDFGGHWTEYPCVEWPFSRHKFGYGVTDNGHLVHRISFEKSRGILLGNMESCHHCDNPSCFHPAHLFSGTQRDNIADMVAKKRAPGHQRKGKTSPCHGSAHPFSRITEADVITARASYSSGSTDLQSIADSLQITRQHARDVVHGKRWKHVPMVA